MNFYFFCSDRLLEDYRCKINTFPVLDVRSFLDFSSFSRKPGPLMCIMHQESARPLYVAHSKLLLLEAMSEMLNAQPEKYSAAPSLPVYSMLFQLL